MKHTGLFVIELSDATLPFDTSGTKQAYRQREPTPAEIKAAHPKCGTCGFLKPVKRRAGFYCSNKDSLEEDSCIEFPDIHYCIYHKPKEQP